MPLCELLLDEADCYYFTIRTTLVVARSFASASKHAYKKNMFADNTGSYSCLSLSQWTLK